MAKSKKKTSNKKQKSPIMGKIVLSTEAAKNLIDSILEFPSHKIFSNIAISGNGYNEFAKESAVIANDLIMQFNSQASTSSVKFEMSIETAFVIADIFHMQSNIYRQILEASAFECHKLHMISNDVVEHEAELEKSMNFSKSMLTSLIDYIEDPESENGKMITKMINEDPEALNRMRDSVSESFNWHYDELNSITMDVLKSIFDESDESDDE